MDLMSNEVWSFFTEKIENSRDSDGMANKLKMSHSEWEWLCQCEELKSSPFGEVVRDDLNELMVQISMRSEIFELKMRRTDDFPQSIPRLSAKFIDGFFGLLWKDSMKLIEIVEEFSKYAKFIDDSIIDIKDACSFGFELQRIEIDEEDSAYLSATLWATDYQETITISVDYENVRNFPRLLKLSNPERMASFDCERWNSDDCLGTNLMRLYRDDDEAKGDFQMDEEEVAEQKSPECEEYDSMDFI